MESLEKYIAENSFKFEEEPEKDHKERFLKKQSRRRNSLRKRMTISVAASVFIGATVLFFVYIDRQPEDSCVNERVRYQEKFSQLAQQAIKLSAALDPWDQSLIIEEIEGLKNNEEDFENEITGELPGEMSCHILTEYYNQNLLTLAFIIEQLESNNKL